MLPGNELLMDITAFMKSRIILSAAELDFFTLLDEKPLSTEELAKRLKLDARAATRVLDCLVIFNLARKEAGIYKLTEQGTVLSAHHPETVLPMILHINNCWDNWSELTETVQQGKNPHLREVIDAKDAAVTQAFIGAMHVIGKTLSRTIAEEYDLSRFKRLLDIGGGSGTYTIAFLEKNQQMTGVIFDLAPVMPMAEERIAAAGLSSRVQFARGDFYENELPENCDLALLSAIIHQNSPEQNLALFHKIFLALEPGGAVLIRDHIMDETRTRPPAGALFAINMLVHTSGGDTYTLKEVKELLEKAGFIEVKLVRSGEQMDCLVEGIKPR